MTLIDPALVSNNTTARAHRGELLSLNTGLQFPHHGRARVWLFVRAAHWIEQSNFPDTILRITIKALETKYS